MFIPSDEQRYAVRFYRSGDNLKLIAVAGSGKTSTLQLMAQAQANKRALYLAFNRSVRDEAQCKFPANVKVYTLHGLAWRQLGRMFPELQRKLQRSGPLRISDIVEAFSLHPLLAHITRSTLENFLRSPLPEPNKQMIPFSCYRAIGRLPADERAMLISAVLLLVSELWRLMCDPAHPFPLSHDGYVKLWAMQRPRLKGVDALLVDEAQDLNPLFAGVLEQQPLQRIYVGDPQQQIYAWRGAINALDALGGKSVSLTASYRFSDDLAAAARTFFRRFNRTLHIVGKASWQTIVSDRLPEPPFAVLCRTNAGVIEAILLYQPRYFHVIGGIANLLWLLDDAESLRKGQDRFSPHPDLVLFDSWDDLVELADFGDLSAKSVVQLAERFGDLRALKERLQASYVPDEASAELIISTAHKAKGREWERLVIHTDFPELWGQGHTLLSNVFHDDIDAFAAHLHEEQNLFYVALTRARRQLTLPPALFGVCTSELFFPQPY